MGADVSSLLLEYYIINVIVIDLLPFNLPFNLLHGIIVVGSKGEFEAQVDSGSAANIIPIAILSVG